MTNPSHEQVEAAARAAHKVVMEHYPGMSQSRYGWDVQSERDREGYMLQARAALVAAAGVTPQRPTREQRMKLGKLIEQALGQCGISVTYALAGPTELFDVAGILLREYPAFVAPVQVDEAKLADVIAPLMPGAVTESGATAVGIAHAVAEWLRGGGQ